MKKLNILTNSSVSCYRTCPRKYRFRYVDEIRSTSESKALTFGSYCHLHWEHFWDGRSADRTMKLLPQIDTFDWGKAEALLQAYDLRWFDWRTANVSPIATEKLFAIPLLNPDTGARSTYWELRGKLDAIALIDGKTTLVEHKSTSDSLEVGSGYFERLRIDSQMSIYDGAMRAIGFDDFDLLYDVSRKPQLRPLQRVSEIKYNKDGVTPRAGQRLEDETPDEFRIRCLAAIAEKPDEYFAHFQVTRLEDEIRDSARDLWFTAATIRESIGSGRFPRNPGACYNYKSFCEYWPICSGVCGPDDSRFEHKPAHEELL